MKIRNLILAIAAIATFALLSSAPAQDATPSATVPAAQYACPMHRDVKSDKPGKCPKCGMELTAVKPEASASPKKQASVRERR